MARSLYKKRNEIMSVVEQETAAGQFPALKPPTRYLFGPGPTMVHSRVYDALSKPIVGHLDAYFIRSEEHTSELQSHRDLHSFPTRRSSDLPPTRYLFGPGPTMVHSRVYDALSKPIVGHLDAYFI